MKITKENLDRVLFENHDARLLIEDVVLHTSANIYYYGIEIQLISALDIWKRAMYAEGIKSVCKLSYLSSALSKKVCNI